MLIYLIENEPGQTEFLSRTLQDEGYRLRVFSTLADFLTVCAAQEYSGEVPPDAVIIDMVFVEDVEELAESLQKLRQCGNPSLPVISVSTCGGIKTRLAALRTGVTRFLVKPVESRHIVDVLDALIDHGPAEPLRVLLLDDDQVTLSIYAAILGKAGMKVSLLQKPLHILEYLDAFRPDVLLIDLYMPEASGLEMAEIVRGIDAWNTLPILFLSSETEMSQQLVALSLGGEDFLVKPVNPDFLVSVVRRRALCARRITALQHRMQATLYRREREHEALNHHAIVSITDRAGRITYVNRKFCETCGYSRDELIGQDHRILRSDAHRPEFFQQLWQTIAHGDVWQGEICNRRKDGSRYWVSSTITPFLDSTNRPYQYVSIRTDITHVKTVQALLRKSEARLNVLLTKGPVNVYACNATAPFATTYVSPNIKALTGYTPEQFVANPHFRTNNIHPEDQGHKFETLTELREGDSCQHEYRFRCHDDSYIWIRDELRLIRDEHGEPREIVGYWIDITKRKQAEESVESHKERLRRGQIYANVGTWDWNIQTGNLFWTERIAPLFGHPEGELETSYANFLSAVHPEDRQRVSAAVIACVERDVPYEIEHRVVWPDGTVRWLLEKGAVQRDAEGRALQMLGVVQDIDDRKRAEIALAEREHQLLEAQSLAHLGNWEADVITGDVQWSDEIFRIFGLEPHSISPSINDFYAAVHPADHDKVQASEKLAAQSGLLDVVHRIVRPDGSIRHVHEIARAEKDENGNPRRLVGLVQDITERTEAEEKLNETQARFAFAVEGTGDGVWEWDLPTDTLEVSGNFEGMLGYEKGELTPLQMLRLTIHPDDFEPTQKKIQEYLEGKRDVLTMEFRMRCKDDNYKWILSRGTLIERDDEGKPARIIGINSDIDALKRAESNLILARDEAERANRAKSEFLSSMSHELRTPMNAILGFGQLMSFDPNLGETNKENVQEILHAGRHLLNLINEVLDLAKIESEGISLSLVPLKVHSVIEECLNLTRGMADARGIRINYSGFAGKTVRGDRVKLKQAILNLLSNAIKYNRAGGSVAIRVSKTDDGALRVSVADTGPGIPKDKMEDVFQPFNRLGAESSNVEGTGIGLTITQRIVELMGGKVGVESKMGVGSTFWIDLPAESPTDIQDDNRPAPLPEFSIAGGNHSRVRTVLYIEDNPSNLKLVAQILGRQQSIHLLTADTPERGIELARVRCPDLILLDIAMQGMDGYQVLEVLKGNPQLRTVPVLAVTANAMERDIAQGLQAGFDGYLTKPLDIPDFLAVLERHLKDGPGIRMTS